MNKICCIFNYPLHYRIGIYKAMDENFDCDFYFGDHLKNSDIQKFDKELLSNYKELRNCYLIGRVYWQKEDIRLLFKDYENYVISAEPYCISTWVILLLAKLLKKKVLVWTHGWYGKETKFEAIVKGLLWKLPTGILLYGNYAKKQMESLGFSSTKLFVIHNSLDYDNQLIIRKELKPSNVFITHFNNNNPVIIFIGRLTKVKKLDMIVKALHEMREKGMVYNAVFIGDGTERQALERMAKEMEIEKNIWFYGSSYDEKINAQLIYDADVCVSPGNVGLTAMHCLVFGTPVITHNDFKHQMPEFEAIIAGETGDFFEADNIESLTNTIISWIERNGAMRESIRNKCMEEIENYWTPNYQIKVLREALNYGK